MRKSDHLIEIVEEIGGVGVLDNLASGRVSPVYPMQVKLTVPTPCILFVYIHQTLCEIQIQKVL